MRKLLPNLPPGIDLHSFPFAHNALNFSQHKISLQEILDIKQVYVCTRFRKECIMKKKPTVYNNEVYVQILINHTSDHIIKSSKFFEIFRDFRGIELSKKCMCVSCCIELIFVMSKIVYSKKM